ncbi:hypothetical protein GOP47_0006037 [Adiantum capillus-veneris]|uniref:Uncharacterized protein n=1 Tax=Adiantum capillus-veneris TaxID=13818 RepID=A0A9D4V2U0_ADICA|nr:hypothetical protein GOP47_0006037 [Adiantum capillus-veneris]
MLSQRGQHRAEGHHTQAQLQATSRTRAGVHAEYLWSSLLAFSKSSNGACTASYRVAFASRANHLWCTQRLWDQPCVFSRRGPYSMQHIITLSQAKGRQRALYFECHVGAYNLFQLSIIMLNLLFVAQILGSLQILNLIKLREDFVSPMLNLMLLLSLIWF